MSLFSIFKKRKSEYGKNFKKSNKTDVNTAIESKLSKNSLLTVEMIETITKYIDLKNGLIEKGLMNSHSLPKGEQVNILHSFFEESIEFLPEGIIIPIKTTFKINGNYQTLLMGKNLVCVGKYTNPQSNKVRSGLVKKDMFIAFLNTKEEFESYNPAKTTRILLEDNENDNIINLTDQKLVDGAWNNFRISNVDFRFKEGYTSESYVKELKDTDYVEELLEYLPILDTEISKDVTVHLKENIDIMEKMYPNNITE